MKNDVLALAERLERYDLYTNGFDGFSIRKDATGDYVKRSEVLDLARALAATDKPDTWAMMDELGLSKAFETYGRKLGWGLTPYQPECWALLDAAVEELIEHRALAATDGAGVSRRDSQNLAREAIDAVERLLGWCEVNEAEWSGWGDQDIPTGATWWRVKAQQARSALDEFRNLAAPPAPEVKVEAAERFGSFSNDPPAVLPADAKRPLENLTTAERVASPPPAPDYATGRIAGLEEENTRLRLAVENALMWIEDEWYGKPPTMGQADDAADYLRRALKDRPND